MEACTSGYGDIRDIIAVVIVAMQKYQQISGKNNMSRSYFTMHATIPRGVRYGDVDP